MWATEAGVGGQGCVCRFRLVGTPWSTKGILDSMTPNHGHLVCPFRPQFVKGSRPVWKLPCAGSASLPSPLFSHSSSLKPRCMFALPSPIPLPEETRGVFRGGKACCRPGGRSSQNSPTCPGIEEVGLQVGSLREGRKNRLQHFSFRRTSADSITRRRFLVPQSQQPVPYLAITRGFCPFQKALRRLARAGTKREFQRAPGKRATQRSFVRLISPWLPKRPIS